MYLKIFIADILCRCAAEDSRLRSQNDRLATGNDICKFIRLIHNQKGTKKSDKLYVFSGNYRTSIR